MIELDCAHEFSIGFLDDEVSDNGCCRGELRIGEFSESFYASTSLWSPDSYRHHWREALSRLETNVISCLAETVSEPKISNFGKFWPLLREGETVRIQNVLLVYDECPGFVPSEPWKVFDESDFEGMGSEWQVSWLAIVEFLACP